MKDAKIEAVLVEIKRFKDAILKLRAERNAHPKYFNHPKESGKVRRASLDLTRALAELRKPE